VVVGVTAGAVTGAAVRADARAAAGAAVRADARAAAGAAVRVDARAAAGAAVRVDARAAAGAAARDRLIRLIVMHGSRFSAAWSSGSCLVNCVAGLVIGSLW
jgi:hypothetical protein